MLPARSKWPIGLEVSRIDTLVSACSETSREDATFLASLAIVRLHTWANPKTAILDDAHFCGGGADSFHKYLGSPFSVFLFGHRGFTKQPTLIYS